MVVQFVRRSYVFAVFLFVFLLLSFDIASAGSQSGRGIIVAQLGDGGNFGGGDIFVPSEPSTPLLIPSQPTTVPDINVPTEIDNPEEIPDLISPSDGEIIALPILEPEIISNPFEDLPVRTSPDMPPFLPIDPLDPDEDTPPGFAPDAAPFYVIGPVGAAPVKHPTPRPGKPIESPGSAPITLILGPENFFQLSRDTDEKRQQLISLATVLITATEIDSGDIAVCTGSHLGNRLVLTARHCLHDRIEQKNFSDFRITFGEITHDNVINRTGIAAKPVESILSNNNSLDYLILKLQEPPPIEYRGAVIKISSVDPWNPFTNNVALESTLIWNDPSYPPFAKMRSADATCLARSGSCREEHVGRLHRCDSSEGSSGAPMFHLGGHELVAIHIAGNSSRSNCALPASQILEDLSSTNQNEIIDLVFDREG